MQFKILKTGLYALECGYPALKLDKQGSVKAAGVIPLLMSILRPGRAQCTRFGAHSDKMDRQSCQTSDSKVI